MESPQVVSSVGCFIRVMFTELGRRKTSASQRASVRIDTVQFVLVELAEHDPRWASMFEAERSRILVALGPLALSIDHVGSTAVPLLAAKPTIDIALTVTDSADETSYVPALERCDFRFVLREPDWFQHRLLRREPRLVNLHVFTYGCSEVAQMIGFRDWLRDHDDDRALYEQAKRALATRSWACSRTTPTRRPASSQTSKHAPG
jgi:GrpB-like predicted nucleotidyltransferase (UPF0157 family)